MTAEEMYVHQREALRAACERANVKLLQALDELRPVVPYAKLLGHMEISIETTARLCREMAQLIEQERHERETPRLPLG